jgi:predicted lysophospholipase L1 biosynthesis ABC-type transport system permease subunit
MPGDASHTGAEHSISAFVVILIFLFGWIKSYERTRNVRARDIIDGDNSLEQIYKLVFDMFVPYLEVWMIVVAGVMVMFAVDKILVTIISISNGSVTLGDSYGTRIFLACFKQWQIIGAIATAFGVIIALTIGFMFWMRLQDKPSESLLASGLSMINIFGLVIAMNLIVIQGYISSP